MSAPIKEYDRRIELLTKERGRISAFARGARKASSPLSACTILFTFGQFQLYEGRDYYQLQSCVVKNQFSELSVDYDALCYCSYFSEFIRYFTRENIQAGQELMLMYVTIRSVIAGILPLPLIRVIFEMRMMLISGEMLELFTCLGCGKENTRQVFFSAGGLVCPECAAKEPKLKDSYPTQLSADALYSLQYMLTSDFEKLFSFTVSDTVLEELVRFMKNYLKRFINHHFQSLDFIE